MTQVGSAPFASTSADPTAGASFVEWGAVFAGAVLAAAIAFVLLTFGTAIGLSATSPWPNSGLSAKVIASLAVFWAMAQQIGAFMVGGYVAGRMRSRWHEPTQHEVEFRDGMHGGLVWAVGVVISAILVMATVGVLARAGVEVAGQTATVATESASDPMDLVLDALLRPTTAAQAGALASPPPAAGGQAQTPAAPRARASAPSTGDEVRAEMSRILANSVAKGSLSSENRAYLVQLVSQRAGISQQEADKRVNDAINTAREAADKARRAAVLAGFVTAAGLIISFGAAWWAALKGGNHRDNSIPARFGFGDRRRRAVPMT
jgi:hypothetical protein